ncbi:MAG: UDP-N-acetylmuramoyl-L-alanyl-D-glutamate--2,6-diaminopimelate ligase [Chitinivibrionales bacterium]|nr:UDP-N-acetylmuramoyl-L-alanyl-D-glutamate--2,6-diaminopimelate ligase [Chitinivibrionales bacterium]
MKWRELIETVDVVREGGSGNPDIADVTLDSRGNVENMVFVAVPGTKVDGDHYVPQAIAAGAGAVVSHRPHTESAVPWAQVQNPRRTVGLLSKKIWADGFQPKVTIGITGTNGKSTTAELFHDLAARRYGADAAWLFGTVAYKFDASQTDAAHTTPESADVFRLIGKARTKPDALVMEVSSHALQLDRVAGLSFDVGVFTNLTQDHFEFHRTIEAYFAAKRKLFLEYLNEQGHAVVNVDDPWGRILRDELKDVRLVTYGCADDADVRIAQWHTGWDGSRLTLAFGDGSHSFTSGLVGSFNRYNLAAFCAGAHVLGYTPDEMQATLDNVRTVAGRMDRVPLDAGFAVVVDYAHTPDALEKVLTTSRELTKGRLITVFGCGGDRDRSKRPLMAEAVARHSDEAVVTSDNPRSESPVAIIDEVIAGMPLDFPYTVAVERESAIRKALEIAQEGDCVVIAGKGHETYQEIDGVKHPFDDKEVAMRQFALMREGADGR